MKDKIKNIVVVSLLAIMLIGMSVWCIAKPQEDYSQSERRVLEKLPELTAESLASGEFAGDFESYSLDQFPLREQMRTVKAASELYLLMKQENNGLYISDGYACEVEYPVNESMLDNAGKRFSYINEKYLEGNCSHIYFSIVPDKHYFLGEKNGMLTADYAALISGMRERTQYMEYIDILPLLSIDDYYKTDTHWRQECITDVAQKLAMEMGASIEAEHDEHTLDVPFYGVYKGRSALPLQPDELKYLTNDAINSCTVTSYDTGTAREAAVYDIEAAYGRDPYEMFLSGSDALLVIENPIADTDKELIIFRDSYASSLAPLLIEGYSKITLVDTRYISSDLLGEFIDFGGQDVLFIYSTSLLNNSLALK